MTIGLSALPSASSHQQKLSPLAALIQHIAPCELPTDIAHLIGVFAEKRLLQDTLIGHTNRICRLQFTADSNRIISADLDGNIIIWDTQTGQRLYALEEHRNSISTFVLSANSQLMAIASTVSGKPCYLRDINTGSITFRITPSAPNESITPIAFSPNSQWLAYVRSRANHLHLENLTSGQKKVIPCEIGSENKAAFLTDKTLIIVDANESRQFWNTTTQIREKIIRNKCVTFHQHLPFYATFSTVESHPIELYNIQTHTKVRTFQDSSNQYHPIQFDPSGKKLIAASKDGHIYAWEVQNGSCIYKTPPAMLLRGLRSNEALPFFTHSDDMLGLAMKHGFVTFKVDKSSSILNKFMTYRERRNIQLQTLKVSPDLTLVAMEKLANETTRNSQSSIMLIDLFSAEEHLNKAVQKYKKRQQLIAPVKGFFKKLGIGRSN